MNQPTPIRIDFTHVNQKVADAFTLLANSLGITVTVTPAVADSADKSEGTKEEVN